jgi:hypothetical protein
MQGRVDTSFQTVQRDLFASGLAATIGMNAFGVWTAIKTHADFETGRAWPGMRRLGDLTGLSVGMVSKCVGRLAEAKLLRVVEKSKGKGKKGQTYIACERLDVRIGDAVVCTIVLDYVPARLREQVRRIDQALAAGDGGDVREVLAECEVIPGPGFNWDSKSGVLRRSIPVRELPAMDPIDEGQLDGLAKRVFAIAERQKMK